MAGYRKVKSGKTGSPKLVETEGQLAILLGEYEGEIIKYVG
jgi:hypothetical protein